MTIRWPSRLPKRHRTLSGASAFRSFRNRPIITSATAESTAEIERKTDVEIGEIVRELRDIAFGGKKATNTEILRALELLGKHKGMFVDRSLSEQAEQKPELTERRKERARQIAEIMMRENKEAVPYIDNTGRYAGFHSIRHSTGSWLAAAGVHPEVVQKIMRHTDINLTMSLYTHVLKGQESKAVDALPDLSRPTRQVMRKTGTDEPLLRG